MTSWYRCSLNGTRSRAIRCRLPDNDLRCSTSDCRWFPARPAQHVHRRRNNGKGQIQNGKRGSRHATIASRDPTRHRAGSTWEARNLLNRQSLFEICVSIPSLTKSLSGALEQFQHNNLVKNEKRQFVKAPHWQDRSGLALGIVCHRLRG
jgi:hypothetical protein